MKVVISADGTTELVELCGISLLERLLRMLERCGVREATVVSPTSDRVAEALERPSWARKAVQVRVVGRSSGTLSVRHLLEACPDGDRLLLLPAGAVYDMRLLELMTKQGSSAVLLDSAPPPSMLPLLKGAERSPQGLLCGPAVLARTWAEAHPGPVRDELLRGLAEGSLGVLDVSGQPTYSLTMRRELRPFWFPAPDPSLRTQAERVLLNAAQKGALDFPAWVHGPIETFLVSFLCKTPITPNQLTLICNVVAWAATALFLTGRLGWGTALALVVGILDGIDGKQARVKVESSRAGKLEHWFDTFFEVSWAVALAYHLHSSGQLPGAYQVLLLLLVSETVDLIAKGSIVFFYGRLIDELSPLDRAIRFVGGRRNVYVWILAVGILMGSASTAFVVMAWWEAATAAVHIPRAAWAIWVRPYDFNRDAPGVTSTRADRDVRALGSRNLS
jgi:phosphatidylglycerophosphate synthase